MKNRNFIKCWVFFLLALFFEILLPRVFLPPLIERWYWYENTIEYPINFYYYNRRSNFCWDIGASFNSSYSDRALFVNQILRGDNLAALFHGASEFVLNDFQPLTSNIVSGKGQYAFFPDYVFNESSCEFNVQVSCDFEYGDDSYIRSTLRCILPFKSQKVTNIASANMYYNTEAVFRKNKAIDKIKKLAVSSDAIVSSPKMTAHRMATEDGTRTFPLSQVLVKKENGQDVFAIQASYVADSLEDTSKQILIGQRIDQVTFPFFVMNKNGMPADAISGAYLSLEDICRSTSVLNQAAGADPYYGCVDGIIDNSTVSSGGVNFIVVNNSVFPSGQNSALLTLYTYPGQAAKNGFCAYGEYNLPYTVLTNPDYIADLSVGDLVTTSNVFFGNGLTGDLVDTNANPNLINPNLIFKVLATGNYGTTNQDPVFPWNRSEVEFCVPPVIVQRSLGGFPSSCGVTATLPNHPYISGNTTGQQFQTYIDYLASLGQNTVTLLKEDGTFLNTEAPYAVLWYANDYTNLFTNHSSVLNNLYITTSIDPQTNLPTVTSQILAKTIRDGEPEPPTPCCETLQKEIDVLSETCVGLQGEITDLAAWTVKEVYDPLAAGINNNSQYLNQEIENLWTMLNINNNVVGNASPLTVSTGAQEVVPQPPILFKGQNKKGQNKKSLQTKFLFEIFENGRWQTMQYNGFHDSGLGDVSLELFIGSYFLQNKAILDLFIGLDCPTGHSIDYSNSYLAVGLGNNGHFVGKLGLQGFLDLDYLFRLRLSGRCYLEHGFAGAEKLVPGLEDFPIFGIVPVKMDTRVSWNGGLVSLDGSLYANDFSGVTLGYQFWNKGRDTIVMKNPVSILIPNMNSKNVLSSEIEVRPDFEGVMDMSKKVSHTVSCNFFSRLTNECFFNAGMSRIVSGEKVPQVINFQAAIGLSY